MKNTINWDDIPSLTDLEVDWEYTPENPLGRREWVRTSNIDLFRLLDAKEIKARLATKCFNDTGFLLDISKKGIALLLNRELKKGDLVNVGFFIGRHKVTSKGVVRNCTFLGENYRIGIEFIALKEEHASFIVGINSSRIYEEKNCN